jgi:hypothetical protein
MSRLKRHLGKSGANVASGGGKNTACRERVLLLNTNAETDEFPFHDGLTFYALARWSDDLLTLPAGEVWPGSLSGPRRLAGGAERTTGRGLRNKFFKKSGFASGFFEGKPRGKTYKQKHLRKH